MMRILSRALPALFVLLLAATSWAQTQVVRISVERANLRVSATANGRVVAILAKGVELDVIETVGVWYHVKVRTSGAEGYVSNGSVEAVASPAARPAPPTPAPQPTAAPPATPAPPSGRAPAAQTPPAPRPSLAPAAAKQKIGLRAFFAADVNAMAAQKSFEAVLGTSDMTGFGGGADVLDLWKNVFVRVAVSHTSKSGNRAFVLDGQAISLGVPIKVSMTPVEIGGGWRFASLGSKARVTPYVGGGALLLMYSETSSFAQGDDVSQTNLGFTAVGGVEVAVSKGFVAGAEAQYRGVRNAIGKAGVSQDFGEQDLGGFTVRVLFGYKKR